MRETRIARAWLAAVEEALPHGLNERDRFCGFSPDPEDEIRRQCTEITAVVDRLRPLHPEIAFGRLDFSNPQAEVNRLHVGFADRHLLRHDLNEANSKLWEELNSRLHLVEAILRGMRNREQTGISSAQFTPTFKSAPALPLGRDDFRDAVLYKNFGTVYLEYSQVGRNFMELFVSGDTLLEDEHIQPFRKMSANCFFWFGHHQGHRAGREAEEKIKAWFHSSPIDFARLGYTWDRQELGIGLIPVATLEQLLFSVDEINAFQRRVAEKSLSFAICA